jgi:hypothetical protein
MMSLILSRQQCLWLGPNCYNLRVMRPLRAALAATIFFSLLACAAFAQQEPAAAAPQKSGDKNPQIKLNFLNVCAPSDAETQEISAALNKIPAKVNYSGDFEVTRGRLISDKEGPSRYVRLRRELSGDPLFNNVQYSLSADDKNITETLVFKARDPKDLLLISIEDQISATAVKPASALDADTPASHIKLERFGKASIALARCENRDQSAYEPLFAQATKLIAQYRKALGLRTMFRNDLTWLATPEKAAKPVTPSESKLGSKPRSESRPTSESKTVGKHLN